MTTMDIEQFKKILELVWDNEHKIALSGVNSKIDDYDFQVLPYSPPPDTSDNENDIIMLIPFIGNNKMSLKLPSIKKDEMEVVEQSGVIFISLSFENESNSTLSLLFDKLCLCCRKNFLFNGTKYMKKLAKNDEQLKNYDQRAIKKIPFTISPDLIFVMSGEEWEKLDKELTIKSDVNVSFTVVVMAYDVMEIENDISESKEDPGKAFGRYISVVDYAVNIT